jgi:hypothetical protein
MNGIGVTLLGPLRSSGHILDESCGLGRSATTLRPSIIPTITGIYVAKENEQDDDQHNEGE